MKKIYLTVIMVLFLLLSQTATAATVNIDLNATNQTIRGFGGMNFPRWIGTLTDAQVDKAFGNGSGQIGLTIMRIDVPPDSGDWSGEISAAQRATNHGAIIFATPWSPPASMKTNGSTIGGSLSTSSYGAYANYLSDFANYMSSNGASLYAISVQNEPDYVPDYESCGWSSSQMRTFLNNNASVIPTRVIAPETVHPKSDWYNTLSSASQLDIYADHLYGGGPTSFSKEHWMTEHYTDSSISGNAWPQALDAGVEVANCMANNYSAYIWWYVRRSYGLLDESGNVTKRGYVMSHFTKFVRPGYVRINATYQPSSNVYVTAYKSGDTVVIVALNRNSSSSSVAFSLSGGSVSSYTKYETTSSNNISNMGSVGSTNTLAGNSINTFVGTIGGTTPDTTPPTPDPMTWSSYPTATGSSTITMTATTATDSENPPVQYYFECTNDGSKSSEWQVSSTYVASGLNANTQYSFRVRARDSYTTPNVTAFSSTQSATTLQPGENIEILGSWTTGTSHTKESGSERALIFIGHGESASTMNLSAVTYGGQPMAKVVDLSYNAASGYAYAAAFILNEAGVAAASGSTFSPTWSGTQPGNAGYASVFLSNVDQTTSTGETGIGGSTSNPVTTSALATNDGDMVILAATCGNAGSYTLNNGFTEGTDQQMGGTVTGATGHKLATGANETPSATYSSTINRQMIIGLVVNAAAGGGPTDTTPPSPDPLVWASFPTATGQTTIAMTATTATDSESPPVEYYFECTNDGSKSSGWQSSSSYTATGLTPDTQYSFRVRARDSASTPNVTGWSSTQYATTEPALDTTPPTPNPMTWSSVPAATGQTTIAMTATTATDSESPPVQYYFECTSDGSKSSSWQSSSSYTASGLTPATQYSFRVRARDSAATPNVTGWSSTQSATTNSPTPDTTPPTPDPMTWDSVPAAIGQTTITMTATTATDSESPPVQYYFECTNDGTKSSSWQSSSSYTASGLNPGSQYSFRVRARDSAATPNITGWSTTQSATTYSPDTTPPTPDPMTWASVPAATGQTTITMTATTATDADSPPVQYYFECTNDGTKSSSWQSSTSYTASGLTPDTQYSFRVRARDNADTPNVTGWSSTQSATTEPPGEGVEILGSWVSGTSHTEESGSNRVLIVIAHAEGSSWRNPTLSTVTYGGQTMTKITDRVQSSGFWQTRAYVGAFILNEAGVNAATSSTISASWGGSPTSTSITSVFLGGVSQEDLVGAYATNGVSNAGTITTSALTTSSGDLVIEGATCTETGTYTANNGFTKGVDLGVSGFDGMGGHKSATGASETPSVTHSSSTNRQALLGFVVQAGGPPPEEPAAPTGLSATAGDATVSLDWNDNSEPDLDGYNMYRSTTSGSGYSQINGSLLSSSNYTDNSVTNGTTYYYVVTAVDTDLNESAYSSEVSATPTAPGAEVEIIGSWATGTSHTKESGTNRALVLIAHVEEAGAISLNSVTYGGQTMTKVTEQITGTSYRAYVVAFVLDEAGVAAAASGTFSPSWSTTPDNVSYSHVFLANVNQADPIGASAGNGTASSSPNPITTSALVTADGDIVIDAAACGNTGNYTLNNGFTEAVENDMASSTGTAGYKFATGANETPSVTHSNPNRQVIIGFVVQH